MNIPAAFVLSEEEKAAYDQLKPTHPLTFRFPSSKRVIKDVKRHVATTLIRSSENEVMEEGEYQEGEMIPYAPVDTYGWDTVFGVHINIVNDALAASMGSDIPRDFAIDSTRGLVTYAMAGMFGNWKIVGGSGSLIHMRLPFESGELDMGLIAAQFPDCNPVPLRGSSIIVQIELEMLRSSIQPKDGDQKDLMMDLQPTSENPSPVKYLEMQDLNMSCIPKPQREEVESQVQAFIMAGISKWVMDHADLITFIFTKVVLNSQLAEDGFEWLTPTSTAYAYVNRNDDEDGDRSILGVLNMTDGTEPVSLASQISPHTVPNDAQSAFLMSRTLVMKHVMLPGLNGAFTDGDSDDFAYDQKTQTVTALKPLTGNPVEDDNGKEYIPKFTHFAVSFDSGAIKIESKCEFEVSWGVTGHVRSTVSYQYKLIEETQQIVLEEDHEIVADYWCEVSAGVIAIGAALAIFGMLIGSVIGVGAGMALGWALFLSALLCAGLTAGGIATAYAIGEGQAQNQLTANLMVNQAMLPFDWTGASKDMELTDVKVRDCLQLVGNPKFLTD